MTNRDKVVSLVRGSKAATFVEVGVWRGDLTYLVLSRTGVGKVWAVDPWSVEANLFNHRGVDLPPRMAAKGQRYHCTMGELGVRDREGYERLHRHVVKRLSKFGPRCEVLRETSIEASRRFGLESVEFVFIDAIHLYGHVAEDIGLWLPTIKPGGILSGDDYSASFPGVVRAVDELVPRRKVDGGIWYFVVE